ncbi:MAG: CoA ester lyase [Gammaproteobacteria bacterium]|nr:CoA ester lyase [Gammaproteobacteria bacterium]
MSLARPIRTMLFVPGNRRSWMEKARKAGADALVFDLEDSVPCAEKAAARDIVAAEIDKHAAENGLLYIRINRDNQKYDSEDVSAVVKPGINGLFVPKAEGPEDVSDLSDMVAEMEKRKGIPSGSIGLVVALETARSVQLSYEIAQLPRVETLVACTARNADVARNLGFTWTAEGLETLYHRSRAVIASRAAGKKFPIGGLWQDVHDLDGLRKFAEFNRSLGFTGEIVLHPSNVPVVNEVYSLSQADRRYYEGMIEAFAEAEVEGKAAVMYEGEHIDIAHVTTAREMLATYGEDT